MTPSFETLRAAMIDSQLRPTGVNQVRVIEAFMPVRREAYLPEALRSRAYLDAAVPLAPGRALMEPMLFGNLVTRADLEPRHRVLVIGAASGYEAAVLGRLVGHVTALESNPALAAAARMALAAEGVANVAIVEGPLAAGWPAGAPYDAIILNGAAEILPPAIADQLADGGRFAGVLIHEGGTAQATIGLKGGGVIGMDAFMEIAAVPLEGFARARGFVF